jgi:hypothetical protein
MDMETNHTLPPIPWGIDRARTRAPIPWGIDRARTRAPIPWGIDRARTRVRGREGGPETGRAGDGPGAAAALAAAALAQSTLNTAAVTVMVRTGSGEGLVGMHGGPVMAAGTGAETEAETGNVKGRETEAEGAGTLLPTQMTWAARVTMKMKKEGRVEWNRMPAPY